jgi:excisionase family DNA binding protein
MLEQLRNTPLLTTAEVAKMLKVNRSSVYRWAQEGDLPFVRFAKTIRFKEEDVRKFIKEGGV